MNRFGFRKQKSKWGFLTIVVLPATSSSTVFSDSDQFTPSNSCAHFFSLLSTVVNQFLFIVRALLWEAEGKQE